MVRNESVLEFIDKIYVQAGRNASKEENRDAVKRELVNRPVLTIYGKVQFYKVIDIDYRDMK